MKLAKKNVLTALIAIIFVSLTVFIFELLPFKKEEFDFLIMRCCLSSELLSFIIILFYNCVQKRRSLILMAGGYTLTAIFEIMFLAVSLLSAIFFRASEPTYLILIVVITTLFLISVIFTYTFSKHSIKSHETEGADIGFSETHNSVNKIQLLCDEYKNTEWFSTLNILSDSIKSCDTNDFVKTDKLMDENLDLLKKQLESEDPDAAKINVITNKILGLVNQRYIDLSQLKLRS